MAGIDIEGAIVVFLYDENDGPTAHLAVLNILLLGFGRVDQNGLILAAIRTVNAMFVQVQEVLRFIKTKDRPVRFSDALSVHPSTGES